MSCADLIPLAAVQRPASRIFHFVASYREAALPSFPPIRGGEKLAFGRRSPGIEVGERSQHRAAKRLNLLRS
ncbi:MAG: hypothetical protein AAF961_14080, partial [Planctomycetota bacterium]